MKHFLLFLFLSLSVLMSASAQKDTLTIKNITFSSAFETKYFKNTVENKQLNKVAMLLALNPATTEAELAKANQALQQAFSDLDAANINSKTLPKKVKAIFDLTHKRFLKKYELVASFDQIMKDGTYNCVSATALYGLMLDHYNIAYDIKQLPTHVYLIADPQGAKVVLESTDPNGGYFVPDAKFKKNYIEYLQRGKLISAEEVRTKSTDELFAKNFQADKNITFQQLVALQYFNEGVKQHDADANDKATAAFQKSYRLYPSAETRYLLTNSLALQMRGINYNKLEDITLLTSFYAMQPGDMYRDEFTNDFKRMTNKFLLEKTDTVFYHMIYKEFLGAARDTVSTHEIEYVYNFYSGRLHALNHNYGKALPLLKKAYFHNKASSELTGFVRAVMQDEISQSATPISFIKNLDNYGQDFPFLKTEQLYHKAYLVTYGRAIVDSFNANKREDGKKYLTLFEQSYKNNPANFDTQLIANLYEAACHSYGRANNITLVKQYARKGLTYNPNNYNLKIFAGIQK